MIRRRSAIGISLFCALAVCAFGAANASALGGTAFTCVPGGHEFADAHCVTAGTSFGHAEIVSGTGTKITGTNAKTAEETKSASKAVLKGTSSGVETEVTCSTVGGNGELTNGETAAKEMIVSGTGVIEYTGCTVTKPAGQGCVVTGGAVTTSTLFATTEGQETGKVKFRPNTGTTFATIPTSGCTTTALNHNYPVTGTLIAMTNGATLTTSHLEVTEQNTLKFGGQKAGLEGSLTISMKEGNPISLT